MTLLELMTVVAILGVMVAMAINAMRAASKRGQINGAVDSLAYIVSQARVRAVTQQCPHFLVINHPQYMSAVSAINPPTPANSTFFTVVIARKGLCPDTNPPQMFDPAADTVVDTYRIDGIDILVDPPLGPLTGRSLMIMYDRFGRRSTAFTNAAMYADTPVAGPVRLTILPNTIVEGNSNNALSGFVMVPLAAFPTTD